MCGRWELYLYVEQTVTMIVLKALSWFFLNPVVYVAILFTLLLGYFRVKQERRSFRIRILDGWSELRGLLKESIVLSIIISLIVVTTGLVMTEDVLIIISAVSLLMILSLIYSVGSPAIMAALVVIIFWGMQEGYIPEIYGITASSQQLLSLSMFIGLFIIIEGILVKKHGARLASPKMELSERGLKAVSYVSKRLWLLPIIFVVPTGFFTDTISYWPIVTIGDGTYGLVLFPFVIGFSQRAKKTLPTYFFPKVGKKVIQLGVIISLLSVVSYWYVEFVYISIALAALGRLFIHIYFTLKERTGGYAVAPHNEGVMIAGILPNSPAENMGLVVGECIRKVNGQSVFSERDLYEAIQINAAHCRLEVLDHQGEVRLRQRVLYRHDHHRLGVIVIK